MSLYIFYGIYFCFFMMFIFQFLKSRHKSHIMIFFCAMLFSCAIASFLSPIFTLIWLGISALFAFISLFICFFTFGMVKHYLVIRYINKIKMDVKIKSTTDFLDGFLFKADVHRWYVIYMPLESSLDIGVEIFNRKPVIGRRMALQCLSRRLIRVIPEMSPEPLCLNHTFISPVDKFYHINDSTKDWVADYISKIRQGHPKPWVTHCDIDRGGAK